MIFDHPWLGHLFGDAEVARLWSAEVQLEHYRAFEKALAQALETSKLVPLGFGEQAATSIDVAHIDIASLASATLRDGLPIPDFVRQLRGASGPNEAAIHTGATSQDVLDTALSMTLRELSGIIIDRLKSLDCALARLSDEHGQTPLIGRTRMQAALPISAAHRLESWRSPLGDHVSGLEALRPRVERLQLGGAVGTRDSFGSCAEDVVSQVADILGLQHAPVWHTNRTAVAEYAGRLSLVTGSLGKIGQDVALMSQQGVDEIQLRGGGASSAMPHKSNPIIAEVLVTLARFNSTLIAGLHHSVIHEQERAGAAWMLEWMILPQMSVAAGASLRLALDLTNSIERIGSHPG